MAICLPDCHTHSLYSFDGHEPVAALLEGARAAGLTHLTLTDHCECNGYNAEIRERLCAGYRDVQDLQKEAGTIRLQCGIELGQATQDLAAAEDALAARPWGVVIGSLHNLREKEDFCYLDYDKEDVPALLHRYFDELLGLLDWGKFDTLAHLTYPLRYICGDYGLPVDLTPYLAQIEVVLDRLIRSGKALELNTSGWRQKMGVPMPDAPILKMYRDMGGKQVTLGSDAHRSADIGADIARGCRMLRELGFAGVTVFEARRPVFYPFEEDQKAVETC